MASEVNEQTHAMVPVNQGEQLPSLSEQEQAKLLGVMGGLAGPILHNFQGTPQEIWRQTAKATGPEALSHDKLGGEAFAIQNFYVHTVQMRNIATGKIDNGIRVVLIDPAGRMVAMVSTGAARDLAGIINHFGMGPFVPPIEVHVESVRTRGGFTVLRLIPA